MNPLPVKSVCVIHCNARIKLHLRRIHDYLNASIVHKYLLSKVNEMVSGEIQVFPKYKKFIKSTLHIADKIELPSLEEF